MQYCIWQQHGKYVLPYRHQWNQEDVFEGAEYMIERLEEVDYEVIDMAYRRLAGVSVPGSDCATITVIGFPFHLSMQKPLSSA